MRLFGIISLGTLLALALGWIIYVIARPELEYSDLKEVNGILLKDAYFGRVKGSRYMSLQLEYKKYKYVIGGDVYEALDEYNAKGELVKGTSVNIMIYKDETFIDDLNKESGGIAICELKSDDRYYVTLEGVKDATSSPSLLLVPWFIFFGLYFHYFWLKRGTK